MGGAAAAPERASAAIPCRLQISFFLVLIGCGWLLAKAAFDHRAQISLSVVSRNSSDWYPDQGMPYSREPRCDVAKEFRHIPPVGAVVHFVPVRCQIRPPNQKLTVFGDSQAARSCRYTRRWHRKPEST